MEPSFTAHHESLSLFALYNPPSQPYNPLHTQCVWRRNVHYKWTAISWVCWNRSTPPLPLPANKNLHFLQWALACNTAILAWQLSVFLSSICHFFCLVFLTNFALAHTHKADSFGLETTDHSSVSTFMREHSQMPFQLVINHRRQRTIWWWWRRRWCNQKRKEEQSVIGDCKYIAAWVITHGRREGGWIFAKLRQKSIGSRWLAAILWPPLIAANATPCLPREMANCLLKSTCVSSSWIYRVVFFTGSKCWRWQNPYQKSESKGISQRKWEV